MNASQFDQERDLLGVAESLAVDPITYFLSTRQLQNLQIGHQRVYLSIHSSFLSTGNLGMEYRTSLALSQGARREKAT